MWNPRTRYERGQWRETRGWYLLIIIGLGILSWIAIYFVRRDRQFLKQIALIQTYVYLAFAILTAFMILWQLFAAIVIISVIIAWWAQGKIDEERHNQDSIMR